MEDASADEDACMQLALMTYTAGDVGSNSIVNYFQQHEAREKFHSRTASSETTVKNNSKWH